MRPSIAEPLTIRGATCHVRRWPAPGAPKLLYFHGWQDCSASFQFVVDALRHDWDVIALDRRGGGLSHAARADLYSVADLLADIDAVAEHYSPREPVRLVAHSLGANVATLYTATRPERVLGLLSLEGYGSHPSGGPADLRRLRSFLARVREGVQDRRYPSVAAHALALQRSNPRLTQERALFLSQHLCLADGDVVVSNIDPWHQVYPPLTGAQQLYVDAFAALARPLRLVSGRNSAVLASYSRFAEFHARLAAIPRLDHRLVDDCGHNLHHDQPAAVAALLEDFFTGLEPAPH